MTCLYIHPPVHYPAPSLSDHLLWGVLEWILKWILNFHPWRFLMKKRLKHRTNTQCGRCVKLVLSTTCEDGPQTLVLAEKAQVSKETLLRRFSYYLLFIGTPVIHFLFVSLWLASTFSFFRSNKEVYKTLGTFDFHPLMFLSYLLNQVFVKMAASCTLGEHFLSYVIDGDGHVSNDPAN